MKRLFFLAAIALPLATTPPLGAQTLIISDNFNTTTTYPNLNSDLDTRQSGILATTDWLVGFNGTSTGLAAIVDNQLLLGAGTTSATLETNVTLGQDFATVPALVADGEFTVSFSVTPAGSYAAFSLGATLASLNARPLIEPSTDFALLMNPNGTLNLFTGGSNSGHSVTNLNWASGPVELTITTTGFTSGTSFIVGMTLGGATVDLSAGAGTSFSGTWDADETNYLILSDRDSRNDSTFDNFAVTAVPEPSSVVLLIVSGVALGWNRRRPRKSV